MGMRGPKPSIDLSPGTRINALTVVGQPVGDRVMVRCDCGMAKMTSAKDLRRGRPKTCGVRHHDRMMAGNLFGRLTVIRFVESDPGHVIADCACGTKALRVNSVRVRNGDTRSCGCINREQASAMGKVTNVGKTGPAHPASLPKETHPNWKGSDVGYSGVHARLKAWRGPARGHACFNCGASALDYAFNNACPDARVQVGGHDGGFWFCPHIECYVAACRNCHRVLLDSNGLMVLDLGGRKAIARPVREAA